MTFALVGNQNCGKTTLFNCLTGSNQHVGNFPGVTVDSKYGEIKGTKKPATVVDLPGIYSIRPYTSEEIVTRDFILKNKPDGIINIADATNIERNLYLTIQLISLGIPMVLALNMMDEVRANGGSIDIGILSDEFGIPVVPISASKNEGIAELVSVAVDAAQKKKKPLKYDFCPEGATHRCIHAVTHMIEDHAETLGVSPRFAAIKLIEGDEEFERGLALNENEHELLRHSVVEMESDTGLDANAALAAMRYDFIESVCSRAVKKCRESRERQRSVKMDRLLTGRFTALPVFVGIMILIFYLTFNVIGKFLSDLLASGIDLLTGAVSAGLENFGINPVVHSLVIDGVFAGVGSVLGFLPTIVVLFFFLSILEDTGYMARVAFVMDKLLRKIGLSGKSIVPMLIGFGCSVPAIMSARTLSSERDRKMTIMLVPFMSCSAKIPIYALFSAAFFPKYPALVMAAMYFGGIFIAVLMALVFKSTLFRGNPVPFVMELPNYRIPSAKSVVLLLWEKTKDFLSRAFTVIFAATVIIWFLQSFDLRLNVVSDSEHSLLAAIGKFIAPVFAPLGFGDWRAATSLISGFTAKEAVVSTLGVLTQSSNAELAHILPEMFPIAAACSFLAFTLLYTPCVAAVATIKKELGSAVKTVGIVVMQCAVAWIVGFAVYRLALMLGMVFA